MTKTLALSLLFCLLPLAACSRDDAPAPAAEAGTAATAPGDDGEAVADAPAMTPEEAAAAAATPADAAADAPAAADAAPAPAPADASALVPGQDYAVIQGGQPYEPANGKIEVVEFFNFICPACAQFQPSLDAWKAKLPADVRFTYVPVVFGRGWAEYAKAYLAAEAMGLDEATHSAVVRAIHVEHSLPGETDKPDAAAIAAFYARHGADKQQFLNAMDSFAVAGKLNKAKQFAVRSQIEGTPTLVVDGKYRVLGRSYDDVLRNASRLIEMERAARD